MKFIGLVIAITVGIIGNPFFPGFSSIFAQSEEFFVGAIVVDGIPHQRAVAQLWNPANSGKLVILNSLDIAHSSLLETGCDMRISQKSLLFFRKNAANKHFGKDDSFAEIRQENIVPGLIPGRAVYECWIASAFDDRHYDFSPPLIIPENYGFLIAASRDGAYLIVSFQFRESAP